MGEIQEVQLQIRCQESAGVQGQAEGTEAFPTKLRASSRIKQYNWWFRVILYAFFLLSGQAVATLLGRLYYDKGGSSKWMATLVQSAGFPVLFVPLFIFKVYLPQTSSTATAAKNSPSVFALTLLYLFLGLLLAGDNMMYSYGLLYLPVSTYSLLCATQLAFNAIFSYFLNSQKFTPFIFNSLVLLTISASLLAAEPNSADTTKVSKGKYVIGFLCTLGASAGYSLWLSLTQLAFQKVIKKETVTAVLEMQIFPSLVATCVCVVGIFASGDWKHLKQEMNEYAEGHESAGVQGELTSDEAFPTKFRSLNRIRQYNWWFRVILYAFFLLSGQAVAILLGRLYYDKGGTSKWMATLVQSAGFPVLFAPLFIFKVYSPESSSTAITSKASPSVFALTLLYLSLGLLMAGDNMMYSYGLLYLPVSTYSLLCATQLAFNAIFSYFLNSQKFTPFIFNSLVLLTISASLLAAEPNSADTTEVSKGKYVIGFLCTLGASAGYSLLLSLIQLAFQKVIKKETVTAVLDMQIFISLVATCVCIVGIFASGDWKHLKKEMHEYAEGKVSYVMTLVWTAISWQISSVGTIGLIFEATSLLSNVISTLGLPIIPIFAVIFFHDKLSGIKVVALFLSLWGFVSYIYQHYIDNSEPKETRTDVDLNEEKL